MKRIPLLLINSIAVVFLLFGIYTLVIPESNNVPKNIIIMISDGCGYNHIDAASLFEFGQTGVQAFETFPVRYGMSTFSASGDGYDPGQVLEKFDYVKQKYAESASSITAISTGVKTYDNVLGLDIYGQPLEHIFERVERLGKATGVVTTVQFSHATPAGMITHDVDRNHYIEIAKDMICKSPLDVIMGCGHPYYDHNGLLVDSSLYDFKYVGGRETWEELSIGNIQSDADGDGAPDRWRLIVDRSEFQDMMSGPTPKRVVGIPKVKETLQEKRSGDSLACPYFIPFTRSVPTLVEMTKGALNVLDNDPDGFLIMIEGGAIDWASHEGESGRMIEEQIDFHHAVNAVIEWVESQSSWDETLLIVTADHECGYLTGPDSGPVYAPEDSTLIPVWNPLTNNGKDAMPGMEWHSRKHTNSLVPFFAKGIGSDVFHRYANREDPVRGRFLDNANIGQALFSFFKTTDSQ